ELDLGGFSDWRLPTEKELITINDYSIPFPAPTINTTFFPNSKTGYDAYYWSSAQYVHDSRYAWAVDTGQGGVEPNFKYSNGYVRCVRGEARPLPNFIDNHNCTVSDTSTGLMWQQGDQPSSWDYALTYCNTLTLGGTSGWRVPNIKELQSLVDYTRQYQSINTTFFPNTNTYYWSSTTDAKYPSAAFVVTFDVGYVQDSPDSGKNSYYFVRCTRNIPTAPSVSTAAISAISQTTATGGGNVTSGGGDTVTARGVCWGISANPTTAGSHTTNGSGTGVFTSAIGGLAAYTTYHVRAYATNSGGTTYGDDISFTTNLCTSDVTRGGTGYGAIQDALSSGSGAEIKAVARVFSEELLFSNSSALTLNGGYVCGFGSSNGLTMIHGTITLAGNAAVTMGNIEVY
ncbi:MAG: DUF1566 domain-containing protein, partial [Desulfuromonadales bacterium]|nr:DUF1566 domain-containing protein [Desulfuromonadales bacterium]